MIERERGVAGGLESSKELESVVTESQLVACVVCTRFSGFSLTRDGSDRFFPQVQNGRRFKIRRAEKRELTFSKCLLCAADVANAPSSAV